MYKLGIDIGINNIGLGIYDSNKKKLIKKKYIPYKSPSKIFNIVFNKITTRRYINFIIKKIDNFIEGYKIEYIGISCPGAVDAKENIFFGSKELVVGKINFQTELKKYKCKIHIENTCNCAAIGEALENDFKIFLMITINTEIGFSIVKKTRKRIILAKDEIICKILKINKKPNTKDCKYIKSFKNISDIYNKRYKKKLPQEAIFDDIKNNKDIIDKYIADFSTGINLINEEIKIKNICIGGSFSLYKRHYLVKLQKKLEQYNIFIAKKYNDSGIIGALNLPIKKY